MPFWLRWQLQLSFCFHRQGFRLVKIESYDFLGESIFANLIEKIPLHHLVRIKQSLNNMDKVRLKKMKSQFQCQILFF